MLINFFLSGDPKHPKGLTMRLNLQLIVLLWTITSISQTDAADMIHTTVNIIKLINEVTTMVLKVWDLIQDVPITSNNLTIWPDKQNEIIERMDKLNERIHHSEELQAEYFSLTIETLKREFLTESMMARKMDEVIDMTKMINTHYKDMTDYQIAKEKIESYTLTSFAEWSVKPDSSSLGYVVERLHFHVFGEPEDDNKNNTLFSQLVIKFEKDNDQMCSVYRSQQQFAYDLYTKITLVEIKAFIMMEYSYMTLRNLGKGNFTQELGLMRTKYETRMQHSQSLAKSVMERSSRVYWRCDPKPWQFGLGKSYDHVSRLLQGYVENEINLNSKESCYETCEDYQDVPVTVCNGDQLCQKQPKCSGRLYSCRFIEADMTVCHSNSTTDPLRRYDIINFDDGRVLGNDGQSKACAGSTQHLESWSSLLFWRCNYCFCLCDEPGPLSDRYFNLRDTLSDYQNNMIVTGARFVKDQRVFHLQLQQGALLPGGLINQSSIEWIPLETYDVNHVDIRNGYDYHELSYDSRSLDLDQITAVNDSLVVTGARFRVIDKHLNLEVRFSLFNFSTGRLVNPNVNSFWLGNNKTPGHENNPREKLVLYDPQVSTKSPLQSRPLSNDNQYMEFINSSLDKDAAQNTVPFIDIQEVVTDPAVPLSGLGIYHRGRKGFGGYFAPKIVTYNLLHNFDNA